MNLPTIPVEYFRMPNGRAAITGSVGDIMQRLARLEHSGRLVSATDAVPTAVPGQFIVHIRLAPPVQPHARRVTVTRRRLPRWAVTAVAGGVVVAVGGAGWLAVEVLRWAISHAAYIAGTLALAAGVLAAVVRLGGGGGGSGGGRTFSGTFRGSMD